jgi:hypothetical protein
MCAIKTCSSVLAVPPQGRWNRIIVMNAMTAIVETFQEALDMRRAARRSYFRSDE